MKTIFSLAIALLIMTGFSSETEKKMLNRINDDKPPKVIVETNNNTLQISSGTFYWEIQDFDLIYKKAVIADGPAPLQIAEKRKAIIVAQNSMAKIKFSDNSQPKLNVYLWEENNRGQELSLNQDQLTLPSGVGRYVIEISARWPNGKASYTFVIVI